MSSVDALTEFIHGRLSAAAAEICSMFLQTITHYHEEIHAQQKLLQVNSSVSLDESRVISDDQEQQFYKDEQLWNKDKNTRLGQEEPKPPQSEEVLPKLEANPILVSVFNDKSEVRENLNSKNLVGDFINEETIHAQHRLLDINLKPHIKLHKIDCPSQQEALRSNQEKPKPPNTEWAKMEICSSPQAEQTELKQEVDAFLTIPTDGPFEQEREPHDELLLCQDSAVAKEQTHAYIQHFGSRSNGQANFYSPFTQESSLLDTMGPYSAEKPYSCEIDGKRFTQEDNAMVHHKRTHTDKKRYTCETCGKSYRHSSSFFYHKRAHSGLKPFSCTTCGKSFNCRRILMAHRFVHADKKYSCEACGKSYKKEKDLLIHNRTHTGEKPYSCGICGKSYHGSSSLVYHMKTHADEKPYSCGTCGKSYIYQSQLLAHKKVHTDKTSYSCEICGKVFCQRAGLLRHRKSHTDEKHQVE